MLSLLSCLSLASAFIAAGDILKPRAGLGPISTSSAATIAGGQVACAAEPIDSFFAGLKLPAPYAAPPGNATAAGPFPYESALDARGLRLGISTGRQFDGTSAKQPVQFDWHASLAEHGGAFANHKATAFDTQAVTVRYFEGAAAMDAHLVPGSPYGTVYLIYALSPITLTARSDSADAGTVRAGSTFNGVLRMVMLADPGHKALLDQHHATYPTAVGVDYAFGDTDGADPDFPPTSALGYLTTKGWMYPAVGNQWRMKYALSNITWNAPRPLDRSCADAVPAGLEYEISQPNLAAAPVIFTTGAAAWPLRRASPSSRTSCSPPAQVPSSMEHSDEMGRRDLVDKLGRRRQQKAGAAAGVYTNKAASNGRYVVLAADGSLVNSTVEESAGEGFRFIKA
ncbi:glycoside hydrolase family 81 protein [Cordyceps fumosorosea ARSEF 2679]|uniref:Glycoside hydrolase family 81 protein n=1 Tax=Cordyceps fumosorosea (strain ARSEF 2679) TaxID=1081104 RepID=A0A167R568_CORFA|nr:glycoside hydrolase family 81 protein [Cordyceps fumosorosea ARSEF 2679]OAA58280.1 glycoside hydrolase family 81 protein [Cordyceps fumosorosea ARSEF 2679]